MITTVLWDVDGTLLDFLAAEKAAIQSLFEEYHLGECTDEKIARYSKINRTYWESLRNRRFWFADSGISSQVKELIRVLQKNSMRNIRCAWEIRLCIAMTASIL